MFVRLYKIQKSDHTCGQTCPLRTYKLNDRRSLVDYLNLFLNPGCYLLLRNRVTT